MKEKRKKRVKNVFEEITTETFPNLKKKTDIQAGSTEVPNKMNPNRPTPKHIIKLEKLKKKRGFLKAARGKIKESFTREPP